MPKAKAEPRLNFKQASVLLIEPTNQGMEILVQILVGFGVKTFTKASDFEQAKDAASTQQFDLIISEATLGKGPDGYDFIRWLRRSGLKPNAYVPVLLTAAHTSGRNVRKGRDCGAHFIVAKPLIPTVLLDRIVWVAQENRAFVECDVYSGPDRRFKNEGPPDSKGRRSTDLSADVGAAKDPNMSQAQIDSLMQPMRAVI